MYKIGVIGDRDSILGFHAAGVEMGPATQVQEAVRLLRRMAEERFAIIFITEDFAREMRAEIEKLNVGLFPAVIPIPGNSGNTGMGMAGIKKAVERAVGADILFREDRTGRTPVGTAR
jgi:V/A-type H+-transporting ATPase subunit F